MRNKSNRLRLEKLEDRVNPVVFNWLGSGTSLILTQVQTSVGALTITDDGAGTITVDDAGAPPPLTVTTSGFSNLTINLLGTDTSAITYDLTGPRSGNVTINVANGLARTLNIDGDVIAGNLTVTGGNGGLRVNEVGDPIETGGNASFTGANSFDALDLAVEGTTIGGNLYVTKFNLILNSGDGEGGADIIGGSLFFNDFGEGTSNFVSLFATTIGLDLNYTGGNRSDTLTMGGEMIIGRNLTVNLGTQIPPDTSFVFDSPDGIIGGNVTITGGNIGGESVNLSGLIGGNISLNLGTALGTGTNAVSILGTVAGGSVNYQGGAGVDTLVYNPLAGSARLRFTAQLGAGNDSVTFGNPAVSPSYAYIDFGAGADTVTGLINFPFYFLNLP